MRTLLLLDGMAIVYRAYYALSGSGRTNSKGMNVSAVLGFTTTLYDMLKKQHPTHIAVAFDLKVGNRYALHFIIALDDHMVMILGFG